MESIKLEQRLKGTNVRVVTMAQALEIMKEWSQSTDRGSVAIVGASATGKTWLADRFSRSLKSLSVAHTDAYSRREGVAWKIDINSVPVSDVYEGWGLGMRDLILERGCNPVFIPMPDHESFKRMQFSKSVASKRDPRVPSEWIKNWQKHASSSPSRYLDFMWDRIKLVIRDSSRSHKIYVVQTPSASSITVKN